MADTTFVDKTGSIDADWLNDVNDLVYSGTNSKFATHPSATFATTSGSSVAVTAIPSWVKKVTIELHHVIINGTSDALSVQIGDSGGIHTTGYSWTFGEVGITNGTTIAGASNQFLLNTDTNQDTNCEYTGHCVITLSNPSTFDYVGSAIMNEEFYGGAGHGAGNVSLDTIMTQFQLAVVGGGVFNGGYFNVTYEG